MSRVLVLAAALAALAGACRDPRLEELQAIRGEVCACKTAACAEAAMKRLPGGVRSDHVAQQVARSMMDCLAKLYERERPSTDPDAEAPAEGASAATAGAAAPAGSAAPAAGSAATRPAGSAPLPAAKP